MLKDKQFINRLFGLVVPIALENLLLACVGASDTIMLGTLQQNSMSAVSLATQIQFVQNVTITGVVAAFQILGAQYVGKGDKVSVNRLMCMSLRICAIVSTIVAALCFFKPRALMIIFTNEEVLIEIGVGYLKIAAISYLITGISQCFIAMIKLGSNASAIAKISGTAVVLNIVLNAVFIFGLFGAPAMGANGAALATSIARVVELILALAVAYKDKELKPDLSYLFAATGDLRRDFVRQLIPLMGAYVIWTLGITSYAAFMGHMGVDAAAANSVASVIRTLMLSFSRGLASGGCILVGNMLGSGQLEKARLYGDRLIILSVVFGVISALLVFACIPAALAAVKLSAGAVKIFRQLMMVLAVYIIGCSFNSVVINGMFAAGGDTMFDVYTLAVTMWCIAVPLAAAGTFLFHWPVWIVYACTCLDEVGKSPWTIYHYKKYKWVRDLTR